MYLSCTGILIQYSSNPENLPLSGQYCCVTKESKSFTTKKPKPTQTNQPKKTTTKKPKTNPKFWFSYTTKQTTVASLL